MLYEITVALAILAVPLALANLYFLARARRRYREGYREGVEGCVNYLEVRISHLSARSCEDVGEGIVRTLADDSDVAARRFHEELALMQAIDEGIETANEDMGYALDNLGPLQEPEEEEENDD